MSQIDEITRKTSNVKNSRIPGQREIFIETRKSIEVVFPEAKKLIKDKALAID